MPKEKSKENRTYQVAWEKDFGWVTRGKGGAPFCKICKKSIVCKKCNLKQHEDTIDHQTRTKRQEGIPSVLSLYQNLPDTAKEKEKKAEIRLATYTACHSSPNAINHLSDIIKTLGKGSSLESIHLHRYVYMYIDLGSSLQEGHFLF